MLTAQIAELLTSDLFNKIALLLIDLFAIWLIFRVITSDSKSRTNQLFSLTAAFFLFWVNGGYFFAFSGNPETSLILGRIILGGVVISFTLLYFFLIYFPSKEKVYPVINYFVVFLAIVFSVLAIFTDFVVVGTNVTKWGMDPVYGPFGKFSYYAAIVLLMFFAGFQMYKKYPSLTRGQKTKVQYFFIGIVIFLLMNLIFNVILPVLRDSIQFWQFGNYAAIFLLGFTAYAIVERKLLNSKVIATEALTVVIVVILLSKIIVDQTTAERIVDTFVFVAIIIFGIFLIRSVNREVRQRRQLQVLTRELRRMGEQKDEFISMAAHELRAPMTAIKGYLSMIMEGDAGKVSGTVADYLNDAIGGSDRMIRLVNNMLNVSRIEEGRMVFQAGTVNLMVVANSVANEFREEAQRKNLGINVVAPNDLKDRVFVDQDRIYEVVGNLVSNAVKYTDHGSITINMLNPNEATVRLEVIDTGTGISSEEQKKLFQKFERAESSIGKTVGTGLGLYISKLLVEKFGGKIGLVSIPGKGSNFWFDLPLNYQTTD